MRLSVGRWCCAHAALLIVSLSLGGKSCCRRSVAGAARTRRCCSCFCRWGQVVRSSVGRWCWCGAHAALLIVSSSLGGKSCGCRSVAVAARTRCCCLCICRWGASRVVVGRPLVLVRRARGAAARVVVVGGQVVWSSVGRLCWCGALAALLIVSLSLGCESCGFQSAAVAARTRRCCSCRCSWGASQVVVGRPLVPARRARGADDCVVVASAQVVWSSVGRRCWYGAHAALLLVSLSLGGTCSCLRSAACAGAAHTRRC